MFEEYVGKHLKNRHKYIGLKYAKEHGFPELISSSAYGYVYYIRAYSTSENPTYDAGTIAVWYGGIKGTLLGNDGFEPYKSEESAKRGRCSWEKRFAMIDNPGNGWKHQVGGVLHVTEEMYTEMEEQRQQHFEIASKKSDLMMERLLESIKRESRRMNFKVIK